MSNIVLTIVVLGLMALSAAVGAAITNRRLRAEHAKELHNAFKTGKRTGAGMAMMEASEVSRKVHERKHEHFCKQLKARLSEAGIE